MAEADLVVNATRSAWATTRASRSTPALLRPGQVVVDLVYHPAVTPLLAAAAAAGARAVGGLGMLVHQAAHAFRLWTGMEPPIAAMRVGAERGPRRPGGCVNPLVVLLVALAGLPVGAFLNVVVERAPDRRPATGCARSGGGCARPRGRAMGRDPGPAVDVAGRTPG